MKVIKHNFDHVEFVEKNGRPIRKESHESGFFSLTVAGLGAFEEMYGESLLTKLASFEQETKGKNSAEIVKMLDSKFVKTLAAVSYLPVGQGKGLNDVRQNAILFKETDMYDACSEDIGFVLELINMVLECLNLNNIPVSENKTSKKDQGSKKRKK